MRVSKAMQTLARRREWVVGRMEQIGDEAPAWSWLNEERRALDAAMPILKAEHERRLRDAIDKQAAKAELVRDVASVIEAEHGTAPIPAMCSRANCINHAAKKPVLSFASFMRPDFRIEAELPQLNVCDEHASADPAAYVNEAGWNRIRLALQLAGRAEPDRDTLRVDYRPLVAAAATE